MDTRDKMDDILQMPFSKAFLWKKLFVFWFNLTEICSYGCNGDKSALI